MKKIEKQLLEELDLIEKKTDDEDIKQRVRKIRKLLSIDKDMKKVIEKWNGINGKRSG